jgi:colanic acid/amylovoran biosynthesis protein
MARFSLNLAKVVIVREELSAEIIKKMNIKSKNIFIRADCAFALDAIPAEQADRILFEEGIKLDQSKTVVGFSMSSLMEKAIPHYTLVMAYLVEHLKEELGAEILMVPHVAHPEWLGKDDRSAQNAVLKLLNDASDIHVICGEYNPMELKGIIAKTDLFIGCRMHSCIAALSSGVPTLALGWSHKYRGIMKEVGLDRYVVDRWDEQLEVVENDLMQRVKEMHRQRTEVIGVLKERSKDAERSALDAAKLAMEYLGIQIKNDGIVPWKR